MKTIASLSHLNIVPYKSCWLEPLLSYPKDSKSSSRNGTSSTTTTESSLVSSLKIDQDSLVLPKIKSAESSFTIDFEYSKSEMFEDQEEQLLHQDRLIQKKTSTYSSYATESKISVIEENSMMPHVKLKWATLFIQMKLCSNTLRHWLDERNKCSNFHDFYKQYPTENSVSSENHITRVNLSIFQQLINGLSYIHSRGIGKLHIC